MARPKKEIDKREFEKLCSLQCTKEETCSWFDLTDKTLERWCKEEYKVGFSEVFSIKRGLGKISLRRSQWQVAEKGNVTMLIWLGKQYLDQKEPRYEADIITNGASQIMKDLLESLKL